MGVDNICGYIYIPILRICLFILLDMNSNYIYTYEMLINGGL